MFNRYVFFWKIGILTMAGSLAAWWLYGHIVPALQPWPSVLPFLLLSFCFTLSHNAIHTLPIAVVKVLAWTGGIWLGFIIYSAFAAAAFALLYVLSLVGGCSQLWQSWAPSIALLCAATVVILLLHSAWKAFHPIYRTVTLSAPAISLPVTLAFVTDIHLSPILSTWHARRLVRKLMQLQPDCILFGGDLIDAHWDFVRRDGIYAPLLDLKAPFGVYAVYGNHDYFDSSIRELSQSLPSLHFLCNDRAYLPEHIVLTGLNDYLHEPANDVPPAVDGAYNILMDHEPLRIAQAGRQGYDLYLGGHTHGGQFFPVTAITKRLFPLSFGTARFGSLTAIVSSGYGFWGLPLRTGPAPEIVVLRLQPISQ